MFVRLEDQLVHIVSLGTGDPPLLLVGGWIGPWQVWLQTIELLAANHRCIAYDHRGAGQTVADLTDVSLALMVDDVFAILDRLEVERCWLGAESQGGLVACAAALRDPTRFHGQFLIGTGPEIPFGPREQQFCTMLDSDRASDALRGFVDLVVPEPDSAHYRRWLLAMLGEAEAGAGSTLLRSLGGTSIEAELGAVDIPTLVIHGDDDRVMPIAGAETLAARIPDAELKILEGVGHVPTITRPGRVAALVEDFIARHTD